MKTKTILLAAIAPAFLLASCGQEPAPEPAPTETATPEPVNTLPAPDDELFTTLFAEACPEAKPVNTAVCKREGLTSENVICEYGLGDDEYLRNKATLTPGDDAWTIADPETVCSAS